MNKPELLVEIEGRYANFETHWQDVPTLLSALNKYREALEFYAYQSEWEQDHPGEWENRMSTVWGAVATEALSENHEAIK